MHRFGAMTSRRKSIFGIAQNIIIACVDAGQFAKAISSVRSRNWQPKLKFKKSDTCLKFNVGIAMPLEYITSQNGRKQLVFNGYIFSKEKEVGEKKYWKCTEHWKYRCRGRCVTNGEEVKSHAVHNHTSRAETIRAKAVMDEMKCRARNTCENPQNIIANSSQITPAVAGKLPNIQYLKRTLQRERKKTTMAPMNPATLEQLVIPDQYTTTNSGEKFLYFDSGPSSERMLLFTTRRNLEILAKSDHWYSDGTFKTAPTIFYQVYTIHGIKSGSVIPLIYALLPNKTESTYTRLLIELKKLQPSLNPQSIMTDFELAATNSFLKKFPRIESRGCFFHFTQAVWRRIQQEPDILQKYTTDADFALKLRSLVALSFVPTQHVVAYFEAIQESEFFTEYEALMHPVMNYFEDVWIGRPMRKGNRKDPMFPLSKWNCYNAVLNDLAKTNNSVEGFHRGFSSLIGQYNPTVWKLIDAFKQEQSINSLKIDQLFAGHRPATGRKIYKDAAERLKTVVQDFANQGQIEYLTSIAQNIEYNVC